MAFSDRTKNFMKAGLVILMFVLALATLSWKGLFPGASAYISYAPMLNINKVWADNDNTLGTRPDKLTVFYRYYYYDPNDASSNPQHYDEYGNRIKSSVRSSVVLSEENDWSETVYGRISGYQFMVSFSHEEDVPGYELLDSEVTDDHTLTLVNGFPYYVDYAWTWENVSEEDAKNSPYSDVELPGREKHWTGEEVISNNPTDEYAPKYRAGDIRQIEDNWYEFSGWDPEKFTMPAENKVVVGEWKLTEAPPAPETYKITYQWTGDNGFESAKRQSRDHNGDLAGAYQYQISLPSERTDLEAGKKVSLDSMYRKDMLAVASDNTVYRFSGWAADWEDYPDGETYITMPSQDIVFTGYWEKVEDYYWVRYHIGGVYDQYQDVPVALLYRPGEEVSRDSHYNGYNWVRYNFDNRTCTRSDGTTYPLKGGTRYIYSFYGWKEINFLTDTGGDNFTAYNDAVECAEKFTMPNHDVDLYGYWDVPSYYGVNYEWIWEGMDRQPYSPSLSKFIYNGNENWHVPGSVKQGSNRNYVKGHIWQQTNGKLYEFSGWTAYNASNPNTPLDPQLDNNEFIMPAFNVLFKGVWKPLEAYSVQYQWKGLPLDDPEARSLPEEPNDETLYQPNTEVTVNKTYLPYTEDNPYILEKYQRDENGDYVYDPEDRYQESPLTEPYKPYFFSGWYKDEALTQKCDATFTMQKEDVILYGEWKEPNIYTIEWYEVASKDADPSTAIPLPGRPAIKRPASAGSHVKATPFDTYANGYEYIKGYPAEIAEADVAGDSSTVLKLYFTKNTSTDQTAKYLIKHEYYKDSEKVGEFNEEKQAKLNDVIDPSKIEQKKTYNSEDYEFKSVTPSTSVTLVAGSAPEFVLRYELNTPPPVNPPQPTMYNLTINYLEAGTRNVLQTAFTASLRAGDTYNQTSPTISGYTLVDLAQAVVSGTMPASNVTVDVFYASAHTLTINYVDRETGETVAPVHTETLKEGDSYEQTSPVVEGYVLADVTQSTISGTMPAEDVVVTVYYVRVPQTGTYTVRHMYYRNNDVLEGDVTRRYTGTVGEIIRFTSDLREPSYNGRYYDYQGYLSSTDSFELTADEARGAGQGFTLVYSRETGGGGGGGGSNPDPTPPPRDPDPEPVTPDPEPVTPEPEPEPVTPEPEPEPVTPEPEPQPEPEPEPEPTPVLPDPNDPDSPDEITIEEDGVPKTYIKVWDPEKEEYVYILDEDVPLADQTPKTGDDSRTALWAALAGVSLAGAAAFTFAEKKHRKR